MLVMEHGNNLKWLFQVMGSSGASFEFGPICLILCVCVCVCVCTRVYTLQRKCCTLLCYLDSRTAVGVMVQNPSGSLTSLVFPQRKS